MNLILTRIHDTGVQTIGIMHLFDRNFRTLFTCKTLELSWRNNERRRSCIPTGKYKITPNQSPTFGPTFRLHDVPNRSDILIHTGNFHTNTLGCILVGNEFSDINRDGQLDVTSSRVIMNQLLAVLKTEGTITITNGF